MRTSKLIALSAALAASALAQETANLTGKVTNSVTGAPVPRAHVMLRGRQDYGALTNGEGKFSITGVAPGGYSYAAERVGFASVRVADALFIIVKAGDNSLDLKLAPVGAISGRVLDADGEPVQFATVEAEGSNKESATTDYKGQYRIGGLAPAKYRLKVSMPPGNSAPEVRTDGSKQVHYMSTYYPGVAGAKGATRVTVAPGSEITGIDIPLLATPIVKVSGKVLDIPAGAKDVNVDMNFEQGLYGWIGVALPVRNGAFEFWGLDPGKITLQARVGDGPDALQSAPIDLEVGTTDIGNLELRLIPPFDLVGHVEYEDDRARQAAKAVEEVYRNRIVRLSQPFAGDVEGQIGADDTFKLENVQPGLYGLITMLGQTFVKSVRLGTDESTGRMLDVRNGAGQASLTITMSAAYAEIGGTVTDSNGPVSGATVLLLIGRGAMETTSDANGHYSFKSVQPGTFRLLAAQGLRGVMDESTMEDYEDSTVPVEVRADDRITQDLKLAPPPK